HRAIADWCEKTGLKDEMTRELERAVLADPTGADGRMAHERLGHKMFHAPKDVMYRPEVKAFDGRYLSAEESEKANAVVESLRAHDKALAAEEEKDPWLKKAREDARRNLRDPAMKPFKLTVSYQKPYVVFVESDTPLAET